MQELLSLKWDIVQSLREAMIRFNCLSRQSLSLRSMGSSPGMAGIKRGTSVVFSNRLFPSGLILRRLRRSQIFQFFNFQYPAAASADDEVEGLPRGSFIWVAPIWNALKKRVLKD